MAFHVFSMYPKFLSTLYQKYFCGYFLWLIHTKKPVAKQFIVKLSDLEK